MNLFQYRDNTVYHDKSFSNYRNMKIWYRHMPILITELIVNMSVFKMFYAKIILSQLNMQWLPSSAMKL